MPCSTIWVRTRFGSASSLSTLLTATTIGTPAAFAWSSASIGLRHDAVVGRHHQHGDVGDLRAAGTHRRERLVAGRVDERDVALADVRLVGTDVLRDATELARDDVGLADRVEQLGLAVVDVAHDGDHRRARCERGRVDLLLELVDALHLVLDADDLGAETELARRPARWPRRRATWWRWPSPPPGTGSSRCRPGPCPTFSAIVCGVAPRTTCRTGPGLRARRACGGHGAGAGRVRLRRPRQARAAAGAGGGGGGLGSCGAAPAPVPRRRRRCASGLGVGAWGPRPSSAWACAEPAAARAPRGVSAPPWPCRRRRAAEERGPRARWRRRTCPLTPICSSVPSNSLLVTPSSFASS